MTDFDAVVVGASLAGCATAIHLGRAGHRVALVDKRPDPEAFKRVCGHFIQSSAVPALGRLGILAELDAAGAARGHARVWTPYGWFADPPGERRRTSLSVRREVLDPLLRRRAAETPGVELLLGHALTGTSRAPEGRRVELSRGPALTARLLMGADGRGSRTAALAGVRTRTSPNARFAYWGYFEGPPLGTGASVHIWFHGRDVGIATPTDAGLMLYVAFPGHERAKAFKRDMRAGCARSSALCRTRRRSPPRASPDLSSASSTSRTSGVVPQVTRSRSWATPRSPPTRSGRSAAAGRCSPRSGWRTRSRRP